MAAPKIGSRGYRGPVHETVRKLTGGGSRSGGGGVNRPGPGRPGSGYGSAYQSPQEQRAAAARRRRHTMLYTGIGSGQTYAGSRETERYSNYMPLVKQAAKAATSSKPRPKRQRVTLKPPPRAKLSKATRGSRRP